MEELESSWNNARKSKGGFFHHHLEMNPLRHWPIDKTHGLETEDLLVANPNHGMNAAEEEDDESQKSDPEKEFNVTNEGCIANSN